MPDLLDGAVGLRRRWGTVSALHVVLPRCNRCGCRVTTSQTSAPSSPVRRRGTQPLETDPSSPLQEAESSPCSVSDASAGSAPWGSGARTTPAEADLIASLYDCGASHRHVARILNVSETTVSRWATGTRTPCRYNAHRLWRLWRDVTAWDRTDTEQVAS